MPETSVQLLIWLRGVEHKEQERVAEEDIYEYGFVIFNEWMPTDGKEFQTYPFEERQENLELMEDLKSHLEGRFPEAEIDLSSAGSGSPLADNSPPAEKLYRITVDARSEDEKAEQREKREQTRQSMEENFEEGDFEVGDPEFEGWE